MISVISSKLQPQYLKQLRDWFVLEWGEVDPFEGTGTGFELPPPLLALDEERLLGYLLQAPRCREAKNWDFG